MGLLSASQRGELEIFIMLHSYSFHLNRKEQPLTALQLCPMAALWMQWAGADMSVVCLGGGGAPHPLPAPCRDAMASAQPQLLLAGLCWTSSPLLHGGFRALCTRTGILLSAVPPAAAPPPPCRGLDGLCRWMGVARALAPLPTLGHALAVYFPPPLRGGDQIRACSPLRPVLGRVLEARCCFCSSEQCSFFNLSFFFSAAVQSSCLRYSPQPWSAGSRLASSPCICLGVFPITPSVHWLEPGAHPVERPPVFPGSISALSGPLGALILPPHALMEPRQLSRRWGGELWPFGAVHRSGMKPGALVPLPLPLTLPILSP